MRTDDFHPNVAGIYIATYAFYFMIFGESTTDEFIAYGLSLDTAVILKRCYIYVE